MPHGGPEPCRVTNDRSERGRTQGQVAPRPAGRCRGPGSAPGWRRPHSGPCRPRPRWATRFASAKSTTPAGSNTTVQTSSIRAGLSGPTERGRARPSAPSRRQVMPRSSRQSGGFGQARACSRGRLPSDGAAAVYADGGESTAIEACVHTLPSDLRRWFGHLASHTPAVPNAGSRHPGLIEHTHRRDGHV